MYVQSCHLPKEWRFFCETFSLQYSIFKPWSSMFLITIIIHQQNWKETSTGIAILISSYRLQFFFEYKSVGEELWQLESCLLPTYIKRLEVCYKKRVKTRLISTFARHSLDSILNYLYISKMECRPAFFIYAVAVVLTWVVELASF